VKVITEGAEIYCEPLGNGPLLLLIHGAMEDAGFYSSAADILSGKFTAGLSYLSYLKVLNQMEYQAVRILVD
jgi:hypothetical protein